MKNKNIKSEKLFNKISKDLHNKKKLKSSFVFFVTLILFYFIIYFILSRTIIYSLINYFFGYFSNIFLNLFSISSSFSFDYLLKSSILFVDGVNYPIIISSLCTGILEFALLSSAILASNGIKWSYRIKGFLISVFVVIFFNLFRIFFTIYLIKKVNLITANFFHGFLFRLFLIIVVLGTYYFWFNKSLT